MKQYSYLLLLFCLCAGKGHAQEKFNFHHRRFNTADQHTETLSTGNSGTGSNIDVVYHRASWTVNPNNGSFINGVVTTYFKTTQSFVPAINFDLIKLSFQNSIQVSYHGVACSYSFPATGNTNILNIILPSPITVTNTLDSVTISYSGVPVTDGLGGGFVQSTYFDEQAQPQQYITTLSESYEDRNWWPCKADMQDKIDSMDINVTVPWNNADTFWVASNGVLVDSAITGTQRTFRYKTRYPMASYLVFLSVAKFNRYYSSVAIDEFITPSYFYLLGGKQSSYYTNAIAAMKKMDAVVQAFSNKLGYYPFLKEKHGYYDGLEGADGMEHQTFSGIASNALTSLVTLDHELMHQWFGDNVTFGTWNDLWLAEGFARYGEILAAELVPSLGYSPFTRRNGRKNAALSLSNTTLWIPNSGIASSNTIWNSGYGSAVYERGCMVVSMLHTICGDEKFFQALQNYQAQLGGKSASTDSLKRFFNDQLRFDLGEFFNDYVGGSGNGTTATGGKGNPVYEIKWNSPVANKLVLGISSQNQSSGSNVDYFNGPVVLRVTGAQPGQDTTIVIYDEGDGVLRRAGNGISLPVSGNAISYNLSFTPVNMLYDDSARTLTTGTAIHDQFFEGYVWYGTADDNWNNEANWAACCGIPPADADITIATVNFAPVLSSSVTVNDISFNEGTYIDLSGSSLTVDGNIKGNGSFKGSPGAGLIISHDAGSIRFKQDSSSEKTLQYLILQETASATIATDAIVHNLTVNPSASLTVQEGTKLVTK